mmetsp:Transcript_11925/g.22779  ORF Transcript_11925/g.22779 Transcript_11925/m.22779 type:complete len:200 (-) Transcript_11925:159-758(-)
MVRFASSANLRSSSKTASSLTSSPSSPLSNKLCDMNSSAVASMASQTPGASSSVYPARRSSGAPAVHNLSKPSSVAASSCTASARACLTSTQCSRGCVPLSGCSNVLKSWVPPSASSFSTPIDLSMQQFLSMVATAILRSTHLDFSCGSNCVRWPVPGARSTSLPSGSRLTFTMALPRWRSSLRCCSEARSELAMNCTK